MDTLSELAAIPDSNIFPGHSLHPLRMSDYAEAEQEAAKQFGEDVRSSVVAIITGGEKISKHDLATADSFTQASAQILTSKPFGMLSPSFIQWVMTARGMAFMTYLSLRVGEKTISQPVANELLNKNPEGAAGFIVKMVRVYQKKILDIIYPPDTTNTKLPTMMAESTGLESITT